MRALGLMSGTSLDGVDAALLETDGVRVSGWGASLTVPYPADLRDALRGVLGGRGPVAEVEARITDFHTEVVRALLAREGGRGVDVVGFHGHTILHRPEERLTWQIGDGARLAESLSIPVVNDFRSADVAAGGQGAPLVPVFHRALAGNLPRPVAILNLGGVGNVTWLGPSNDAILAFDTGPGNALIDDWALRWTGHPVDLDGELARQGSVDGAVVEIFSRHPYFARLPPKSLDRDDFARMVTPLLDGKTVADGAATLTALTVRSVLLAQRYFPAPAGQWLVCGGGRHNPVMMAGLRRALGVPVDAVESVGWNGDALEAQAFAFLAVRTLRGLPLTFPGTTGVARPLGGGRIHGAVGPSAVFPIAMED